MVLAAPTPTRAAFLPRAVGSQLQGQGSGVTRCGLALKSADPQAPQGETLPSNCLAWDSSALQHPDLLRFRSSGEAGSIRSPSPGLCTIQTCISGSVYTCPWSVIRATGCRSGGPSLLALW